MRGWSYYRNLLLRWFFICPAYAGMILGKMFGYNIMKDLSRVCGDDPSRRNVFTWHFRFVPRMRGWSPMLSWTVKIFAICPAYAGMIPDVIVNSQDFCDLSRVCGDNPRICSSASLSKEFVPRMRGWSYLLSGFLCVLWICPAYAGMIPQAMEDEIKRRDLSRVCGDNPW